MTRGIDAAATGMASMLIFNDVLANNLANVNTPGFKQSISTFKNFQDVMVNQLDASKGYQTDKPAIGTVSAGCVVDSTVLDLKQGSIKVTGNPLDLAINGDGFFTVKTPNGEAYTRNGRFIRLTDGTVATTEGYALMGESGPIKLDLSNIKSRDILVDEKGTVRLNDQIIDKLKIADFKDKKSLAQIGNSAIVSTINEKPVEAGNFKITQGGVESSNANVVECMVNSITGSRIYETMAKIIESDNKTLSKAVNEVGRMKR